MPFVSIFTFFYIYIFSDDSCDQGVIVNNCGLQLQNKSLQYLFVGVYYKSTEIHSYLLQSSFYSCHVENSIPFSQFLDFDNYVVMNPAIFATNHRKYYHFTRSVATISWLHCQRGSTPCSTDWSKEGKERENSIYVHLRTVPPFVTAHTFCTSWVWCAFLETKELVTGPISGTIIHTVSRNKEVSQHKRLL